MSPLTSNGLLLELRLSAIASSSASTPLQALHGYMSSLPTATAVPTTVQTLVRLLLLHTAVQSGSSHLVLGTSLTSLAVSLISGISQGRGYNLKEEVQEEWVPDDSDEPCPPGSGSKQGGARARKPYVRVIRPLRDIGRKECALWAWWRGLNVVGKEQQPWSGAKQDIGILTRGTWKVLSVVYTI